MHGHLRMSGQPGPGPLGEDRLRLHAEHGPGRADRLGQAGEQWARTAAELDHVTARLQSSQLAHAPAQLHLHVIGRAVIQPSGPVLGQIVIPVGKGKKRISAHAGQAYEAWQVYKSDASRAGIDINLRRLQRRQLLRSDDGQPDQPDAHQQREPSPGYTAPVS